MISRRCLAAIVVPLFFLPGCSDEESAPSQVLTLTDLSLKLDMSQAPPEVVSVRARLSREEHETLSMFLDIEGNTAAGTFEQVAIGPWHLKVDALDSEDVIKFTGEMDVMIEPGYTEVDLVLNPADGSIRVNVRWASGAAGNALRLDGVNDWAIIENATVFPVGSDALTLEAWVRPHSNYYNTVMIQGRGTCGIEFARGLRPGAFFRGVDVDYTGAEEYWGRLLLFDRVPEAHWSHVALTFERNVGIMVYLDGEMAYQTTATGDIDFQTDADGGHTTFWIGGRVWNDAGEAVYFKGDIDEIRVWGVARSKPEIQSTLYSELTGSEAGLLGYWNFNEEFGSTVAHDGTPNGNDAVLENGANLTPSFAF